MSYLTDAERKRADEDAAAVNKILNDAGMFPPYGAKVFETEPSTEGRAYLDGLFVTARGMWGDRGIAMQAAEHLRAAGWHAVVRGPGYGRVWAQRPGVEPRQPLTGRQDLGPWRQEGPATAGQDEVGGDDQVGGSASKRFIHAELPGRLLTVTYHPYVDSNAPGGVPEKVGYGVQLVEERMVCGDIADPGGTEIHCDYRYHVVIPAGEFETVEAAEYAALNLAHEATGDMAEWDGAPGL